MRIIHTLNNLEDCHPTVAAVAGAISIVLLFIELLFVLQ